MGDDAATTTKLTQGATMTFDLEEDELGLLIQLLSQHIVHIQRRDSNVSTPFEANLILKMLALREAVITGH